MQDTMFNAFKAAFIEYGWMGLVAVGLVLAAFFVIRYVLFKWMDNRFQQSLEAYKIQAQATTEQQKHDLQKILEDKKYDINSRFDRTTRINQLEFQMLPDLWSHLNDAIIKTQSLSGIRQYPDVSRLSEEKLKRHLVQMKFTDNQIETVVESNDKDKSYRAIIDAIDHGEAAESFNRFAITMRKSAIFIQPDLFVSFKEFEDIVKSALIECDMNRQGFYPTRMFEHRQKLSDAAGSDLNKFEARIRDRLWGSIAPEI